MSRDGCRPRIGRRPAAWLALVLALVLLAGVSSDAVAETHTRIKTSRGPVHVWTPAGYDAREAGIVIYVHGYFTDVDRAWKSHRLAEQFASSGLNAMFVACGAPRGAGQRVVWDSLDALLASVRRGLDDPLPEGPVIAVGHSGAHRTLSTWLDTDRLDTIVLIDALYGEHPEFKLWIEAMPERRLINVGDITRPWTDDLHASLPETLVFDEFPPRATGRLRGARAARIVYVRSRQGHMPLVTAGVAIPMLLRALRLPRVAASAVE